MKTYLLLIISLGVVVGCSPPKAPAMKRVPNHEPMDAHYLKEIFVPSYTSSKTQLSNSVSQLEEHLVEFQNFMQQVEFGTIPVTQGFKGDWQSFVTNKDGTFIAVEYSDRLGSVIAFNKRINQDPYPLIYGFFISTNGYLVWAETKKDLFLFDEHGKVLSYSPK